MCTPASQHESISRELEEMKKREMWRRRQQSGLWERWNDTGCHPLVHRHDGCQTVVSGAELRQRHVESAVTMLPKQLPVLFSFRAWVWTTSTTELIYIDLSMYSLQTIFFTWRNLLSVNKSAKHFLNCFNMECPWNDLASMFQMATIWPDKTCNNVVQHTAAWTD